MNIGSELAQGVISGDRRSVAQAISLFENNSQADTAQTLAAELWPRTGNSLTVGITGPPGVGKSTLTGKLIEDLREQHQTVGVIAVDPSSPLTNGALLGDRIRMGQHATDQGVFMRSMSSRGHLGGTAEATFLAAMVLDASGKDVTIIETVGVGQSETEIKSLVDSVVVVLQPGSGDSIQAIKSGLMEIPDIICLNKMDAAGAAEAQRDLLYSLALNDDQPKPQLVKTSAESAEGIAGLWTAIMSHRQTLGTEGLAQRRRSNLAHELSKIALARLTPAFDEVIQSQDGQNFLDELQAKSTDPLSVIRQLVDKVHDN